MSDPKDHSSDETPQRKAESPNSSDSDFNIPGDLTHPLWRDYSKTEVTPIDDPEGPGNLSNILEEISNRKVPKALDLMDISALKGSSVSSARFYSIEDRWPWSFRSGCEGLLDTMAAKIGITKKDLLQVVQCLWRPNYIPLGSQAHPEGAQIHTQLRKCVLLMSRDATAILIGVSGSPPQFPVAWSVAEHIAEQVGRKPDELDLLEAGLVHLDQNRDLLATIRGAEGNTGDDPAIYPVSYMAIQYPDLLLDKEGEVYPSGLAAEEGTVLEAARQAQCREVLRLNRKFGAGIMSWEGVASIVGDEITQNSLRRFLEAPSSMTIDGALSFVQVLNATIPREERHDGARAGEASSGTKAKSASAPKGTKRSTKKGEAQAKLVAALTKHHEYATDSCLNLEPINNNELARKADVANSTATEFFNKMFGGPGKKDGHSKYMIVCRDAGRLADSLKVLNGEFSPDELYGRQPPEEPERVKDE